MEEDNILHVARQIYSQIPKEPCTIEFGLDDCAPPNASEEERLSILFEILTIMFLEGIKVRYGDGARPENLTPVQIRHVAQYVLSYGFSTLIESDDLTTAPAIDTRRTGLSSLCERFYDIEREKWYEVSFDWANIVQVPTKNKLGHHLDI
jgi:hypothetical protein